ncbi:organic hydroperoxide resistance protein [Bryobacterales bacterium F-183]|nr:organic hydroperoxide resistance protein [Bryobacterales bacterium F-183]
MEPVHVLYTATASATGGRNGHTKSGDGLVDVELSVPKSMGGPGRPNTTTPEDLFAAGYAACFGSALEFVARQKKLPVKTITVNSAVGIGTVPAGGFGLTVSLEIHLPELDKATAETLVHEAHQVCPYSNATRNNVDVKLTVA